jgi:adenine-specific DNA-methyltransferase
MNLTINKDCIPVLKDLESGSIDLVVTSPPYGIGKDYEFKQTVEEYKDFAREWTEHIPRILTKTGSFWLNVGYIPTGKNQMLPLSYLYHEFVDMPMVQEIVWQFSSGMSWKNRFNYRSERWLWFSNDPANLTFNLEDIRIPCLGYDKKNNPKGKVPDDVWLYQKVGINKDRGGHPCPYPVQMIQRIVKACSNKGDIVLDPFAGTMTTAIAASSLDRGYICIEKDTKHYKHGLRRLDSKRDIFAGK